MSLVAKTRIIKEFQDRCHKLNTTAALGVQGGGGRGIARGGGNGHRGGRGGSGVAREGRYRAKRPRASTPWSYFLGGEWGKLNPVPWNETALPVDCHRA